jgi:hypothetical protein
MIGILQYLYQAVIAPLLRDFLKEKILSLKHRLQFGQATLSFDDELAVKILIRSVSSIIKNLRYIDLYLIYRTKRLVKTDPQLASVMRKRAYAINQIVDPELREIVTSLDEYLLRALIINSSGLLFWLSPVIFVAYLRKRFLNEWSERLKLTVRSFAFVQERVAR